jgi:hypothetical protein
VGLTGGTQSRVSGLGSRRGEHLRAVRGTAKLPRVAVAPGTRRSGHTPRRRGSVRRQSPATASTDDTARGVNNKCVGWPPHLLAQILNSSLLAMRRRRRGTAAAAG